MVAHSKPVVVGPPIITPYARYGLELAGVIAPEMQDKIVARTACWGTDGCFPYRATDVAEYELEQGILAHHFSALPSPPHVQTASGRWEVPRETAWSTLRSMDQWRFLYQLVVEKGLDSIHPSQRMVYGRRAHAYATAFGFRLGAGGDTGSLYRAAQGAREMKRKDAEKKSAAPVLVKPVRLYATTAQQS